MTRLLGADIEVSHGEGLSVRHDGKALPIETRYGHLWTTIGAPERPIFAMPEWDEPDRRPVYCGAVHVRASGLRVVENFLDLAHFPYVHTEILGTESKPEVSRYQVEHREAEDEVWATKCEFFQPQAAKSAEGGQMSQYMYRVMHNPFLTMLYKTPPTAPERWDIIALFVQPAAEDYSIAHPFMLLIDEVSTDAELIAFQQMIFLQDRIVLENQRPRLLPLQPGRETPTRGDLSSVIYRRWLKEKGLRYGVEEPVRLAHA
jgi:phenylpropionate dioxygenase-like ring-hydroxylating dioxygenase large terminal subunit